MEVVEPFPAPSSMWVTYAAAGERLGLTPGQVAVRARLERWPTRRRSDTGDIEVEVPGDLPMCGSLKVSIADEDLVARVSQAVGRVDREEAMREREQAFDDERAIAKARAAAPKRRWWRFGR